MSGALCSRCGAAYWGEMLTWSVVALCAPCAMRRRESNVWHALRPVPALYADGGVVAHNPSPYGVTWAWRRVPAMTLEASVTADGFTPMPGGTNNVAELIAVTLGLEALPDGWRGYLASDSQVTLGRLIAGWALVNVPPDWQARFAAARARLRSGAIAIQPVLLAGHPTRAQLAARWHAVKGLPVSEHNVACDAACTRHAQAVLAATRKELANAGITHNA